jgi:hypothetical protein
MIVEIAPVVEGQSEVEAVPILIRRIAAAIDPTAQIRVARPIRIPKSRLLKPGELERAVELAALKTQHRGAILVLIDADDDCPAEKAQGLVHRMRTARADRPSAAVLAKAEYEAWFLAGAVSLRGHCGLPDDLAPPADAEAIRGAKEWLSERMPTGRRYMEVLDQPALTSSLDLAMARGARSFRKFEKEVGRLVRESLA